LQPLKIITQRKTDFDNLKTAHSQLDSFELKPTLSSFLKNSPMAINHGFLRPYFWETKNIFSFLLSLELLLFEALILIAVYFYFKNRNKQKQHFHFFLFYMLLIAGIMIVATGFIVPNYNSIARYRSLFLSYLLTPILMRFYLIQKSKVKNC
jgi:NADH:ubiquinone oxidoreductase subunit K